MLDEFTIVLRLTSSGLQRTELVRDLKDFAVLLGWEPSDQIEPDASLERFVNAHLLVEHGLQNAAVITFLASPFRHEALQPETSRRILAISYNNLTDWHIYVEPDRVTYVYNRTEPPSIRTHTISRSNMDPIRSAMFAQITGAAPNANFPALDDALIHNISYWKRLLAAELENSPRLDDYSALFNSLIFARAAEDLRRRQTGATSRLLLDVWERTPPPKQTLQHVILTSLQELLEGKPSNDLIDTSRLGPFQALKPEVTYDLLSSFYKSRAIPYAYDFAIMSKHALSRIYEKYVAALAFPEAEGQLSYLPSLPEETYSRKYGSVYTPQFIARFFARYLREQLPPKRFRQLDTIDPACGSGIFLRTLLEQQSAPTFDGLGSDQIDQIFTKIRGVDIDPNAVQATRLSLSLLYLVLMGGRLPEALALKTADAIRLPSTDPSFLGEADVVITNPPFVPVDRLDPATKQLILTYMGELATGRIDAYMPFLKLAIDLLRPNGFGLFVLPHSFLRLEAAGPLRQQLAQRCTIRVIADLSAIPVFQEKGTYVILLVFQKKDPTAPEKDQDLATILQCQDFVSHALRDLLDGKLTEGSHYTIFQVEQSSFQSERWQFLPPSASTIRRKVSHFAPLSRYLRVSQGIVTGADDVFIIPSSAPAASEAPVWRPFLPDRTMQRYTVPSSSKRKVFYPIVDRQDLLQEDIARQFPLTWSHLTQNEEGLRRRKSATSENWWRPLRPRDPALLFAPKIVTPHLVLLPKFSIDIHGKYAVSHSPMLTPYDPSGDIDILKFFLGILNSSPGAWLLSTHTDKYSRGYARLEVSTLRSLPVPDPTSLPSTQLAEFLALVETRLSNAADPSAIDKEIDAISARLYGLDQSDLDVIGFEGTNVSRRS